MPINKLDAKRVFWIVLNIAILGAVLLMITGSRALSNYAASLGPSRTISVSAEGKTVVAPDIASVSFSVVTEGEDPEAITDENTRKINSAIEFIKEQGVAQADIKTANFNLSPRYQYDREKGQSFIIGYTITQSVFIKIRDFEKIGVILGGLPSRGINRIDSLSFEIEDRDEFLNVARAEAFTKAKEKAKTMARQNGVRIGRVVTFSESSGGFSPPIPLFAEGRAVAVDQAVPAIPTIEPGTEEVTVFVHVVYEIK